MQSKPQNTNKSPWLYGLLWLFFVYLYFQILSFNQGEMSNVFLGGMYFIEFGVHEASHIILMFLPQVMVAAAGSLGEITFTVLLVVAAFRARAFFAGVFATLWLMLAMNSVGIYMADARVQSLPLIGPGENVKHDWNFVFGQLGWLHADTAIGGTVRVFGDVLGAVALLYGLALVISMIVYRQTPKDEKSNPVQILRD